MEPVAQSLYHYEVPIVTKDMVTVTITCIGLDKITENGSGNVDITAAYELFPHVPSGAFERPTEDVHILIGQDHAALLASGGEGINIVGNLRAMRTKFGSGWVLGGWHKNIPASTVRFSTSANVMRNSRIVSKPKRLNAIQKCINAFPELNDIAVQLPRACNRCKNCRACTYEAEEATRLEQEHLKIIRANVFLDLAKNILSARYPLIRDISMFQYNEWQAQAIAISLEKQLRKLDDLDGYNEEMDDFRYRGTIAPTTREKIREWQEKGGVVNFISHHAVNRPDKATTKKRLVSNSSLKNGGRGPAAN